VINQSSVVAESVRSVFRKKPFVTVTDWKIPLAKLILTNKKIVIVAVIDCL